MSRKKGKTERQRQARATKRHERQTQAALARLTGSELMAQGKYSEAAERFREDLAAAEFYLLSTMRQGGH